MALGFDAFGRLAFGQISTGQSLAFTLVADSGAYTVTGQAAQFLGREYAAGGAYVVTWDGVDGVARFACQTGAYALTGNSVAFGGKFAAQSGSYSISGGEAATATRFKAVSGSYAFSGSAAFLTTLRSSAGSYSIAWGGPVAPIRLAADPGQYVVTWGEFALARTGDDFDQVYGGVGHYLEEVERLKRLQAITRVAPPAVFKPMPPLRRVIAPQRQTPAVAAPQVDRAVLERTAALKRQQQEAEIIILLAS